MALSCAAIFGIYAQDASGDKSPVQGAQAGGAAGVVDETSLKLPEDTGAPANVSVSTTGSILRALLVLALTAAAVYGLVYFIRRLSKGRPVTEDPNLKVLASASLGGNRFVHVVSVGPKAWLLGASDAGVALISEIEDKETVDAMLLEESQRAPAAGPSWTRDFAAVLSRLGGGERKRNGGAETGEAVRKRRERLTRL